LSQATEGFDVTWHTNYDFFPDCANPRTFCVCYFGGDPASQMPHALATSRLLAAKGVAICWETAGTANPRLMDRAGRDAERAIIARDIAKA